MLGSHIPDGLAGAPDLQVPDLLHLGLVALTVVLLAVVVERALGLGAVLDRVVQVVEDGLQGVLELGGPVDGATAGGGGAGLEHPVHAVGTDEGVQALGGLLDGLVEGLAGAVAALTEDLVLGEEHTVDTAHQAAALTVQVRVDLLLEGGLVEVARADSNAQSDGALLSLAGDVLVDGKGGVDATALTEERADSAARTLGSAQDDINVLGNIDLGEVLEDGGEAVREVQSLESRLVGCEWPSFQFLKAYLALGQLGLDGGPGLGLGGVGEQVHDDGTAGDGLVDLEEVLAGDPAVLLGVLPGLAVLSDTDDDVEAVVAEVKALAVALRAVADEGQGVVLEVLLQANSSVHRALGRPNAQCCFMSQVTHQELLLGPVGTLCEKESATNSDDACRFSTHRRRPPCGRRSQSS